ncbi:MAG: pyruvate kinase, partial [Candidatus Acidiferrum sp.]
MAFRHSKIVCTIGPASRSSSMVSRLIKAGMDVARLNFSHGTHAEHAQNIAVLRAAAVEHQKPIAILADL